MHYSGGMETETNTSETYDAFGESYTITRTPAGNWCVTHDATGTRANGAFGTRGYATHYARSDAQRRWAA